MKIQLVVRQLAGFWLDEGAGTLEWCWVDRDGQPDGHCLTGSLTELGDWYGQLSDDDQELPVSLVVSGDLSGCFRKTLQDNQRKHWQQALPYLLEEQLASDIDALHLVSSPEEGLVAASAGWIRASTLSALIRVYREAGVELQRVLPESQFLQADEQQVSVWIEGASAYVAIPGNYGQWLDSTALELVVPSLLADDDEQDELAVEIESDEENPEQETVVAAGVQISYGPADQAAAQHLAELAGVPVDSQERAGETLLPVILPALATRMRNRKLLDLRTGAFKCTRRSSKRWRLWRPVAITAGVWLGLELLFNVGSGFYFQSRTEALKEENLDTYLELRPDDRRVVDVRHNLTRFLKEANSQNSNPAFLDILKTVSVVSASDAGEPVTPRSIDFNESNGRLSLDVRAESFESLNRYLDALKSAGLRAQMETGNQDGEGVAARLTVRSA
ncbi:type II secretion system protein GspL [Parendozoicomonas haliclonae]|uniref:Type II secretion system protein L n=1 Tax=Parendozoicomonas haliclonae TaxID=1960125 RepID=A0A1X7APP6_9GAMM|nr:type II secretion system protein GspL [Parendozoicomonas haliclonae]SMA49288.1 Type II secretion system protein L [Parendozoicomonas haliclonae]